MFLYCSINSQVQYDFYHRRNYAIIHVWTDTMRLVENNLTSSVQGNFGQVDAHDSVGRYVEEETYYVSPGGRVAYLTPSSNLAWIT